MGRVLEVNQSKQRPRRSISAGVDLGEECRSLPVIVAAGAATERPAARGIRGGDAAEDGKRGSHTQ